MAAHVTVTMSTNATTPATAHVQTMRRHLVTTITATVALLKPINVTLQGNLSFFLYRYINGRPYLILGQYDSQSVLASIMTTYRPSTSLSNLLRSDVYNSLVNKRSTQYF